MSYSKLTIYIFVFFSFLFLSGCGTKIGKKMGLMSIDKNMDIPDDYFLTRPLFLEEDIVVYSGNGKKKDQYGTRSEK